MNENKHEKMRMCLYEAQTADGKTVRLISHFDEKTTDPEATKAVVMPLLRKTPEYAKVENVSAKIRAQRDNVENMWHLAGKARKDGDKKNEAVHTASYKAALSAITEMEKELRPLVDDYNAEYYRLYNENKQPSLCGPGQCCCNGRYAELKAKYDALKEHERLDNEGKVWDDWRGVEYWIQTGGRWKKDKIEFLGEKPGRGFVLPDNITPEIQFEISAQQEAERLAAMTPEEKAKWKQNALDALADEAYRLEFRNKVQRKPFDAIAYYDEKAQEIEAKYA